MTGQRCTHRAILLSLAMAGAAGLSAQSLNWDGQTGGLITPFAYTAAAGKGLGRPNFSYHYLGTGPVIGNFNQASVTVGAAGWAEFGLHAQLPLAGRHGWLESAVGPRLRYGTRQSERDERESGWAQMDAGRVGGRHGANAGA